MSLRIAPGLELPLDSVARTFAVLGQRGSGKTSTAVVLAEEMARAGGQIAVVDPTGAWWGLASNASGKGPGIPVVVFGGYHGDVPLEETAGSLVADLVVRDGYSVVLDLELLRKGAQIRFMADFGEALYHSNRDALHLIVDEADRFAPQMPRGADPAKSRALGALEDIVKLGRRKGLGATLVTQRPATLNKNVLEQAETLICHRLVGPRDRKAIAEWFEAQGEEQAEADALREISKLPRGAAQVFSPAFLGVFGRYAIRKKTTYDSSATPEVGARRRSEPRARADVDLGVLRDRMAATIERVKADDPRELRREIAALKRQLVDLEQRPVETPKPERVEVPVLTPGQVRALDEASQAIAAALEPIFDALNRVEHAQRAASRPVVGDTGRTRRAPASRAKTPAVARVETNGDTLGLETSGRVGTNGDTPELKAGARRIVETLARHHPMRMTRAQLGTLAKFKVTGGTFGTYWGQIKRAGLAAERDGELWITDAGLDYAGAKVAEPMSTQEIVDQWRSALKRGAREMLDVLLEHHPDPVDRDTLAEAVGMAATGGTFGTYLGTLRRNGLAEVDGPEVRAGEALFLSDG